MAREIIPEERVDDEIERLNASEAVKLARKELRLKYKKRQYLYTLRSLEKRGLELMAQGVTMETLSIAEAGYETEGVQSEDHTY